MRKIRNTAIMAKIQPTVDVDAVPTGAANAMLVSEGTINPYAANNVSRDVLRGFFGGSEMLVGSGVVEATFKVEIQSSGTPGTPPAYGALMRSCGLAEDITAAAVTGTAQAGSTAATIKLAAAASAAANAYTGMYLTITGGTGNGQSALILGYDGTSKVADIGPAWAVTPDATSTYSIAANTRYRPISTGLEMATVYYYLDGVVHKLINCKGDITDIGMGVGERPLYAFKVMGIDGGVATSVNPGADLSDFVIPDVVTNANTADLMLGGIAYRSRGLKLALGNKLTHLELLGADTIEINDRDIGGSVDLDLSAADYVSFHAAVKANQTQTLGFMHGNATGRRMGFVAPGAQLINPRYTNQDGVALAGYDLRLPPVAGGDDLFVTAQ